MKKEYDEACCYCGRPGRPGDCYEGKVSDREGACPSCGYPYRGLPEAGSELPIVAMKHRG